MWIRTEDALPPIGQYVLVRHNRDNWFDSTDQDNVNCVVVKRVNDEVRGNNRLPYSWHPFGPGCFFGQDISHWCPIPSLHQRTES